MQSSWRISGPWEYTVKSLPEGMTARESTLNLMGMARWELVSVTRSDKVSVAYFKRPKASELNINPPVLPLEMTVNSPENVSPNSIYRLTKRLLKGGRNG